MLARIKHNSKEYKIDLSKPLDISIPLRGNESNVSAWNLDPPKIEPHKEVGFIGKVSEGASVNFNDISFNPHAHGTHTECLGHITEETYSINRQLSDYFFLAEIYKYENTREHFMSLLSSKKTALIVINAKAQIGYDLKKVLMHADTDKKKIILTNFPQPEVLSIQPELEFYDIKNGLFNSFTPKDLTALNQEAKKHVMEKIPESGLMDTARREALEAVLLIEKIVETIGWKLDYSTLELSDHKKPFIEK